ncbi:hypothetical protein BC830DRAFT_1127502 [Chytriomyces sp. MP71]|nr:hypothetical protein BC830DRAFT_1127502 [Chytriomyces sp. MP71]
MVAALVFTETEVEELCGSCRNGGELGIEARATHPITDFWVPFPRFQGERRANGSARARAKEARRTFTLVGACRDPVANWIDSTQHTTKKKITQTSEVKAPQEPLLSLNMPYATIPCTGDVNACSGDMNADFHDSEKRVFLETLLAQTLATADAFYEEFRSQQEDPRLFKAPSAVDWIPCSTVETEPLLMGHLTSPPTSRLQNELQPSLIDLQLGFHSQPEYFPSPRSLPNNVGTPSLLSSPTPFTPGLVPCFSPPFTIPTLTMPASMDSACFGSNSSNPHGAEQIARADNPTNNNPSRSSKRASKVTNKRTRLTPQQREYMLAIFERDQNPSSEVIREVVERFSLNYRHVQYWYQNKRAALRRAKK